MQLLAKVKDKIKKLKIKKIKIEPDRKIAGIHTEQ